MTPPPAFAWRKGHVATRPSGRGDKKIRAFSHFSRAVSQSRTIFSTPKKNSRAFVFRFLFLAVFTKHLYWAAA